MTEDYLNYDPDIEREQLLNSLLLLEPLHTAPAKKELFGKWYETIVAIGDDHTATILIDSDAYYALLERNNKPVKE